VSLIDVVVPFAVALAIAALATPVVARFALAIDAVDRPNDRKVSRRDNMPLLGGLAVALGCVGGLFADQLAGRQGYADALPLLGYWIGGGLMLLVGALDDRFEIGAWRKLGVQLAAAWVAYSSGFQVDYVTGPFIGSQPIYLPTALSVLLTVGWIVLVTNAINLIDGLDGLAAGTGAIVAATLTIIAFQADQAPGVILGIVLVGALLGFLPFNFSPARIFLGDTGAYFIGFTLALLALEGYRKASLLTFMVPVLAFAVPFLDTGLSVLRRLWHGKGIFSADKFHMHHRLLQSRGTARRAVLSLYFLTGCFCVIAISFAELQGPVAVIILLVVMVLTVRLIRNLGIFPAKLDEEGEPEAGAPAASLQEERR